MWLDILNKPQQGNAFHFFGGKLMNVPEYSEDEVKHVNTHPDLPIANYRVTSNYKVLRQITKNMMNEIDILHIQHMSVLKYLQTIKTGTTEPTKRQSEKINTHNNL